MSPTDVNAPVAEEVQAAPEKKTQSAGKKFIAHALSILLCIFMTALFCALTVRTAVSDLVKETTLVSAAKTIDLASVPLEYIPGVMPEIKNGTVADWVKYYFSPDSPPTDMGINYNIDSPDAVLFSSEDLVLLIKKLSVGEEAAKILSGYGSFILYGDDCTELSRSYIVNFLEDNKSKICNTLSISETGFKKYFVPYVENSIGDSLKPMRSIEIEMALGKSLPLIRFAFSIWCVIVIGVLVALSLAAMTALHKKFTPVLAYAGAACLISGILCLVPTFGIDLGLISLEGLIPAVEIVLKACAFYVAPVVYRAGFFFVTLGVLAIIWAVFIKKVAKTKLPQ